ncbi:hypothetical protein [Sporosarcina sp. BP05]|uniref:hypothetical protein n=1 Tax=Sporosarcina sp. BP05 TaxID=2758726 RepID=UPI0016490B8B|nr:hypothetical protein [Sporosarcina sp. BP05]
MGILCPCGVSVNACSKNNNVEFISKCKMRRGNITYLANVCVTTLNKSTLSLEFVDTKRPCSNNFLFTANAITSIVCKKDGQNCVVTVEGTGLVNGRQYSFKAVFRDQIAPAANDIVQSFVIKGFFDQNGAVCVPQGSIIALGCQEL